MAAEDFFNRWAKVKPVSAPVVLAGGVAAADGSAAPAPPTAPAPAPPPPPPPTMEDVASLTGDSDYSRFMGRGVDQAVQRGAMKKLFADPHYNIMDGLDIYIGDYNTFEPMPAAMLALLDHAKGVLDPRSMFEKPVMQMISVPKPAPVAELDADADADADVGNTAELVPGSDIDADLDGAAAPESEPGAASESEPGRIDPDTDAAVEPAIEPEPKLESEPDSASDPVPTLPPAAPATAAASVTVAPLPAEPVAGIVRPIH